MCGASAWPLCMACGLRGRKGCVVDGPSRMPVPQRVCLSDVKIGPCLFCILASCNKGNGQGWVRREACMRRHSQGFCSAAEGDRVSALLPWQRGVRAVALLTRSVAPSPGLQGRA